MAMLFEVEYPSGERAIATGYPNAILVVQVIPRGPEACYGDQLEVSFTSSARGGLGEVFRVVRIVGGPRRPTIHVRVEGSEVEREAWMDARDAEGWMTCGSPEDPTVVWLAPDRDGLEPADLERAGFVVIV